MRKIAGWLRAVDAWMFPPVSSKYCWQCQSRQQHERGECLSCRFIERQW